jgi:hypothetical protein
MWWTPTCRNIRHDPARRTARFGRGAVVDRHILRLIKMWLKTPVEETDPDGRRRMSGGKSSTCGTPQGGVISPLLANHYINRFLRHWRQQGRRGVPGRGRELCRREL